MREILIGANDAGQRIDKFIIKAFPSFPKSMLYKLIRKKKITVNRKRTHENYVLSDGDIILVFAPDDLFGDNDSSFASRRLPYPDIVYEDENVMIVQKPSGLLVHSDEPNGEDNLIDRIKLYLISKGEYDPAREQSFAPSLCNRIDRNTEGLVIAAKNARALREMNSVIKDRAIKKIYLAAVHGVLSPPEGEINLFLQKDSENNVVHVRRSRSSSDVKSSVTHYKTVSVTRDRAFTLLEVELITGRTHQIRVSFAHIGHPLLGDGKYAVNKNDRAMGYDSQALCAYSVQFGDLSSYELLSYLSGKRFEAYKPDFLKLFD